MPAAESKKVKAIVDGIGELTVLELAELITMLEDKFGVKAAMPTVAAAPVSAATVAPAEEQTLFQVFLTDIGSSKLQVIKEVRAILGLKLKESKDFVEGELPVLIKENVDKKEAGEIRARLETVGATIEIK